MGDAGVLHQALIERLPDALVALDLATDRFILANSSTERLLGYTRDELAAMTPADLVHPDDLARLAAAVEAWSAGGAFLTECRVRRKDGFPLTIEISGVPIDVGGRRVVVATGRDVARRAAGDAWQTLLAQVSDRLGASLEYDATLRTVVTLIVPGLADRCAIDLLDPAGQPYRAASGRADPAADELVAVELPPVAPMPVAPMPVEAAPAEAAPGEAPSADPASPSPALPAGTDAVAETDAAAETVVLALRAHGRDLGTLSLIREAPRTWHPDARWCAEELARRAAQAIDSALLWRTAQRELARRAALLRIARAFSEGTPGGDRVMQVLLDEALAMLDAEIGGIALWDAPTGRLVQVYSPSGRSNMVAVSLDESLSGRAAVERRPVISHAYQEQYGRVTPGGRAGARAGIAAPLLHEGRLLGTISVGTSNARRRFTDDDAEALELLASVAASMLGTLERAQLQAVSLASRELAHRLNNDLALAIGTIDLLRDEPTLDLALRQLVDEAAVGLARIAEQVRRLQQLVRFQTHQTPVGPALDLERSISPGSAPHAP